MSWSRSSKLGLAAILFIALVAAVGLASAVTVTESSVPEEAQQGEQVTLQFELQDLYAEESSWNLGGQTSLENPTWTVEQYQGDSQVSSNTYQGSILPYEEIEIDQSADQAPDRIVVEVTGTVPAVDSFSYAEPATFRGAELAQVTGASNPPIIGEWQIHHYTSESQNARTALDDADATIQSAEDGGADVSEARSTFEEAVSAYDSGNFDEAVSLADQASSEAESAGSSDGGSSDGGGSTDGGTTDGSDGGQTDGNVSDADGSGDSDGGNSSSSGSSDDGGLLTLLLYGLFGLLILGAVGGGLYWYQQQNKGPSRDPLG